MPDDVCPCHGEPWYYSKRGHRKCVVTKRFIDRAYATSDKGRERRRRADKRYRERTFRLTVGGNHGVHLGTYPCTPEQREAISAFKARQREEQLNGR